MDKHTLFCYHFQGVQMGFGVVHAFAKGEVIDDMAGIETGRRVGLHVVYVDVIE